MPLNFDYENFLRGGNEKFYRYGMRSFVISNKIFEKRFIKIFVPTVLLDYEPHFWKEEKEILKIIKEKYGYHQVRTIKKYTVERLNYEDDIFQNSYGKMLQHTDDKKYNTYLVSEYYLFCERNNPDL